MAERCERCTQPMPTGRIVHRFCNRCQSALLRQGLCKWCGERPRPRNARGNLTQCCAVCQQRFIDEAKARPPKEVELLPDPPTPAYRNRDARENTRDTKSGG